MLELEVPTVIRQSLIPIEPIRFYRLPDTPGKPGPVIFIA